MATEFHFFPLLPRELREQIWNLAIRPALPGAHVFWVQYNLALGPNDPFHRTTSSSTYSPCLAAPQCLPKGIIFSSAAQAAARISWTLNNPSTYLIDSGLWTACKESLLVIEKAFRVQAGRDKAWSHSESFRKQQGRFTLPETTTHTARRHGGGRYLTVFHHRDLVILQSDNITDINWSALLRSFPNYTYIGGDWKPHWEAPKSHIALEYNPAWDRLTTRATLIQQLVWNITESGCAFSDGDTLWFVDYRIKRNPRYLSTAPADKRQTVFYASDRRYVEVKNGQLGGWAGHHRMWDNGNQAPAEDEVEFFCDRSYRGSDEFVMLLGNELKRYWNYDRDDWEWDAPSSISWVKFGLLACEYL